VKNVQKLMANLGQLIINIPIEIYDNEGLSIAQFTFLPPLAIIKHQANHIINHEKSGFAGSTGSS
jgi:hypothetical protein